MDKELIKFAQELVITAFRLQLMMEVPAETADKIIAGVRKSLGQ